MTRKWDPGNWDSDPRTLPAEAVKRLRKDRALADQTFMSKCEAFNAGLVVGVAAAQHAAQRARTLQNTG